ncbi:MAG: mechanosensitive ion channel domain-containing protein [Gammaproteobacteria bacterium]
MRPQPQNSLLPVIVPLAIFLGAYALEANVALITGVFGLVFSDAIDVWLPLLAGSVRWMAGSWLLGRIIVDLIINPMVRRRTGLDAPGILGNFVHSVLLICTIPLVIKFVFDHPIGGIVASSGLVTLIIGLAIRDMIADFFSGVAMNIERPYSIGDWVELEPGLVGRVTELNWRSTRLVTQSHRTVIVPNNNLASRQFINYSLPQRRYRESLNIALNYTTDPERAENILTSAVMATPGLSENGDHNVRIREFNERGVEYEIRFWIDDLHQKVSLRHRLAGNVLRYLHQAGVPIPYGQQEVLLTRERKLRTERRLDVHQLLSRMDLLCHLTHNELEQLSQRAKGCDYAKGSTIFERGDEGSALYLLVEGIAEASVTDSDLSHDDGPAVAQIEPGQAFGEMSVLTGAPRGATVRALTNVHALEIRRDDIEPIFRARPEIANDLAEVMAHRVRRNEATVAALMDRSDDDNHTSRARHLAGRISQFFGLGATH